MFTKEERSTFPYWFAHWRAFNKTAIKLKCWRFKYLFHDFEKPWLMWIWKDYKRVQKFHRTHNRHHLEYAGNKCYDFDAMVVDWECSRLTKLDAQLTARQQYEDMLDKDPKLWDYYRHGIESSLIKLGL